MVKVGVTNDLNRRQKELNSGFPPAAVGKWKMALHSIDYPDRKSAELAEDEFKKEGQRKLESLGGEFFAGDWMDVQLTFAAIPGVSRF